MREILFRGKKINNGEWVEGYFIRQYGSNEIITADNEIYHITPETVGQYTGLTDKNGTRIFEGDIVKVADKYIDYAIWANGCFCMARQIMYYEFSYLNSNRVEVIGNIHDNPKLLKGD